MSHNKLLQALVSVVIPLEALRGSLKQEGKGNSKYHSLVPLRSLGKLGLKEEAAGKIRVFAMVDGWTQWCLSAYHEVIFLILKDIPMDGTFNQTAPLKLVRAVRGMFSLDLSAATDRLPISIQRELLGAIFGYEFATHWSNLLVGRTYSLFDETSQTVKHLSYAVGQPMGALSSWASLAITHHFLVQVSAWRAGFPQWKLYSNYAVLGDDVVIGDKRVATQYLLIMESLGVGVNTSKSLLSSSGTALEFAKRTIVNGIDVSPVAFKEFYAASRNIGAFVMLVKRTGITFASALQAMGAGWKVRSWLNKPIGKLSARIRLLVLAVNIPTNAAEAHSFFAMGAARVAQYRVDTVMITLEFLRVETAKLFAQVHSLAPLALGGDTALEWALKLAKSLGATELMLDTDVTFQWEGYQTWYSEHSLKELDSGTTSGAIWQIAWALACIIKAVRQAQTRPWKLDLNRLATEIWELMHLDPSKTGIEFAECYIRFLKIQQEIAAFSRTVEATSRPNPPADKGILDPQQIRLWKRWSSFLQGTQALEALITKESPATELIAEPLITEPPVDEWLEYWEKVTYFQTAAYHEGYYNPWMGFSNQGPVRGKFWYF